MCVYGEGGRGESKRERERETERDDMEVLTS
jgi:hypothetical protein